jgi:hypothetical protein
MKIVQHVHTAVGVGPTTLLLMLELHATATTCQSLVLGEASTKIFKVNVQTFNVQERLVLFSAGLLKRTKLHSQHIKRMMLSQLEKADAYRLPGTDQ